MLYIRTGDQVGKPFTIPLWVKILALVFACYFVWITVEYFRYYWLLDEIAKVEASAAAKYEWANHFDELTARLEESNKAVDFILETIERTELNEPSTLR